MLPLGVGSRAWLVRGCVPLLIPAVACATDPVSDAPAATTGTTTSGSTTSLTSGDDTGVPMVGQPPAAPVIVSPADGDIDVPVATELCWEPVDDPEGNRLRYRVWLDDIELSEGKLSEELGHDGPCLPVSFNHSQEYTWRVQAFEADFLDEDGNPVSESPPSDSATFTTVSDGSAVVFDDDFDGEDMGWTVGGDRQDGAWVHGLPQQTQTMLDPPGNDPPALAMSQPGACGSGDGCWFTGHNPDGVSDQADVQPGTTTLTSPAFDLSGFASASVRLDRFVFKQVFEETGTRFRAELLVPDPEAPEGFVAHVLHEIELFEDADGANAWAPVEYAVCGVPLVAGTRLRFEATDLGEGILEAAVDSVQVFGYLDTKLCDGGDGALCDPNLQTACADGYLCCSQGTVNDDVFRCEPPALGLTYPGGLASTAGCDAPDLIPTDLGMTVQEDDIFVGEESCLLVEECVGGTGQRHLLRFDTITPNVGSADLVMGVPSNHPDLFHYSDCHGHYHFDGYAVYDLLDTKGNVVAEGHKQAFCLLDWENWSGFPGGGYNCSNQGISSGWQDVYGGHLDCNWIDITGVPPGDYVLRISVNPALATTGKPPIIERDYDNNVLERPVTIAG
jgi:hypothetical protein